MVSSEILQFDNNDSVFLSVTSKKRRIRGIPNLSEYNRGLCNPENMAEISGLRRESWKYHENPRSTSYRCVKYSENQILKIIDL